MKIVDTFISKPILVGLSFVRRNPGLTIFILIVLFLIQTLYGFLTGATALIRQAFVNQTVKEIVNKVEDVIHWTFAKPERPWIMALAAMLFAPLWGLGALAWLMLDRFKRPKLKIVGEPIEPEPPVIIKDSTPETADTPIFIPPVWPGGWIPPIFV